ncbi:hypothetical protein F2Q70_00033508 [Brassica cretica]|uniref:Replication protein A 70 kDa DNA-binding subunit B/D first OB fold domain-containing protein n=1 Tax=Brassica cretica TaxID=69181 RepID=A0A8S9FFA6_BRACR|nr:hypothetical protein F2Q70_00033508 [Brassica cretica]
MSLFLSSSSNRRSRHPSLNRRVSPYSVIHGFISAGRANHYMPSLKVGSVVKVDRFEMWLGKFVLSKALALAKKQLESLSISSSLIRDSLNFKKDSEFMGITVLFLDEKVNSVIHGFIPAGRANHYMPSLKVGSVVKVDRFEVARCSSMYKIIDHPFLICFISPTIIDEVITDVVGQIRFVQGSGLSKETTRVVIHLLIDP